MLDKTIVVGPFQCNCRLLACPRTGEAVLVDPGDEPGKILKVLDQATVPSGLPIRVKYLLHTHAHLDHIGATRDVRTVMESHPDHPQKPLIALHRDDEPLYKQLKMQGRIFRVSYEDPLPVEHFLEDGEEIKIGDLKLSIVHTPGHSPGGVCIRLHEDASVGAKETLFTGDTLFDHSIGRTDLWGGDSDLLISSIRKRIFTLDDDTRVCPGHGTDSRIGIEKRENPFLV